MYQYKDKKMFIIRYVDSKEIVAIASRREDAEAITSTALDNKMVVEEVA